MVVALYIAVLDWDVPDFLREARPYPDQNASLRSSTLPAHSGPNHEVVGLKGETQYGRNFIQNIIYSSVLFVLCIFLRRILSDYDVRSRETHDPRLCPIRVRVRELTDLVKLTIPDSV